MMERAACGILLFTLRARLTNRPKIQSFEGQAFGRLSGGIDNHQRDTIDRPLPRGQAASSFHTGAIA